MEALRHALVISKCVLNKPPVQKKKAVLPAVAQTREGPPHLAGDLVSGPGELVELRKTALWYGAT